MKFQWISEMQLHGGCKISSGSSWKDLIVAGKFFLKNEMFDRNEKANVTTKQLKPTSLNWV